MKIKHIIFIFLLLILQLSSTNSFASVCLREENVDNRIEFSEKSFSVFSEHGFKENHIFEASFHEFASSRSVSLFDGYAELVEGWKILSNGKASLRNIDNVKAIDAFKKANPGIADDAIQAAFDGLKTSRKQAFVNALGSCADNKNLIGSLNKTKLASVDEIKDALNKMRDYRTGKTGGGNYGYLEGDIPNVNVNQNKMWESVSIEDAELEIHIFDAIEATGSSGSWVRITDSEYRMLNQLASDLKAVKGGKYPDVTGTLKIVSENPYCTSCQGVIQQFSDMFPNIEITLIDGIR